MGKGDIVEIARKKGLTPAELGRIGGLKARGKPKRFAIKPERNCTSRCPLWNVCLLKYIAIDKRAGRMFKKSRPEYKIGKCALAFQSEKQKKFFKALARGDEKSFDEIIKEFFASLMMEVDGAKFSEKAKFLKNAIDVKNALFGERRRIEANIQGEDPFGIGRMLEIIREQSQEE